jgi:hypothetical protein
MTRISAAMSIPGIFVSNPIGCGHASITPQEIMKILRTILVCKDLHFKSLSNEDFGTLFPQNS